MELLTRIVDTLNFWNWLLSPQAFYALLAEIKEALY